MGTRVTLFRVAVKVFVAADKKQRRMRQQRLGRATAAQRELYAQQRRRRLPPGHPYA